MASLLKVTRVGMSRRTALKAAGVMLSLPWLEAMMPSAYGATPETKVPNESRRFVSISYALGMHGPFLNPKEVGTDYKLSRYLEHLKHLRKDFTVISGTSHPGVSNGHTAEASILTAKAVTPGNPRNSISLDQLMAERLGHTTRIPSLALTLSGTSSPSYTANGSMIPAERDTGRLFARLFVTDSPAEQKRQVAFLQQGRSIMDVVMGEARAMQQRVGKSDAAILDNYFTGVRELEKRLQADEAWTEKAKPKAEMPTPIGTDRDMIIQQQLFLDLMALALEANSTKFITLHINGSGGTSSLDAVTQGYHTLSHHGQEDKKIAMLALIQDEQIKGYGRFVERLKNAREGDGSVLDRTMVLLTSNLGNSSSHDCRNMPVIFAGGGFKHGKHIAFTGKDNYPLPNLYLSALHRLGLDIPSFATSTGTMAGLDMV